MITCRFGFMPHGITSCASSRPAPVEGLPSAAALRCGLAVLGVIMCTIPAPAAEQVGTLVQHEDGGPRIGFWVGASPASVAAIGDWLNRPVLIADASSMYHDITSWEEIERTAWLGPPWGTWVAADERRQLATVVPLMPSSGATWADAATGAYDGHYAAVALSLVEKHLGRAILRLGGAFNAHGPMTVKTRADAVDFARTWQHAVTAMRAVAGADRLSFAWGGTNEATAFALEEAYPGDALVDDVGVEVMDRTLDPAAYPYPTAASDSERLQRQTRAWEFTEYAADHNGLAAWLAFAHAHGKPVAITQWGLYADHHNQCGYDNPYYIRRMHEVIADPANHVAFALYFNYYHCSKISPTGSDGTNYPASSALFHDLFALPAR
jgi:hypothetical protein